MAILLDQYLSLRMCYGRREPDSKAKCLKLLNFIRDVLTSHHLQGVVRRIGIPSFYVLNVLLNANGSFNEAWVGSDLCNLLKNSWSQWLVYGNTVEAFFDLFWSCSKGYTQVLTLCIILLLIN